MAQLYTPAQALAVAGKYETYDMYVARLEPNAVIPLLYASQQASKALKDQLKKSEVGVQADRCGALAKTLKKRVIQSSDGPNRIPLTAGIDCDIAAKDPSKVKLPIQVFLDAMLMNNFSQEQIARMRTDLMNAAQMQCALAPLAVKFVDSLVTSNASMQQ